MGDNSQIFELFFIRYVNYLNIWSVQLNTDNLYSEISDGLLLGVLLKHWSRLYGYNANGNLNLFKRPLSNNQALANIEICINYIINPPENSYLPQYNSSNELDISPNDIYFKNKLKILGFCNDIFHLYMAPYLRLKSQKILSWFNKYINLHGLSLSEETMNGFYQLIPINNELNNISNLMSERLSSWKLLVEIEHNVKDNVENLNNLEYYNPLQCDITSDGCILLMILLYHMGWIDVSLLCQMVYIPQSRQHFLWNHETIYYTLQEIKKHLELRSGILLDIISDHVNTSYMNNYDLPFLLLPLSCLSMVRFSPYIIMLQLDIFYNILTEIVEEDVEDHYNSNNLPLYGPYHPIDLQFLDDFTFKDGFPLSWNLISYKNETENSKSVKNKNSEDSSEINSNNSRDILDNSDSSHYWDSEYDDYNNEVIYNNNSLKIQNVETEQDYQIDDIYSDNTRYTDEDSNETLYDKTDDYIDFRDKVNCPKKKPFIKKNIESISKQDYQNNESTENIHLSKISHDNDSVSVNDMISGLEVELKLLRGYEEDIKLEYSQEDRRYLNNEIKEDISNNIDISNNSINNNQIKVEDNYLSRKLSNKSLLSRSGIETNKQEILDNKDVDTFGIFNITRKSSDAVSKIATAMRENDRLLEKLRQSLNKANNNQSETNAQKKVTLIPCKLEIVENIPETNSNTPLNENYNPNESISIEVPKIDNVNIEQININTSQKKNKKTSRVSFSDLVMIEVERSKSLK